MTRSCRPSPRPAARPLGLALVLALVTLVVGVGAPTGAGASGARPGYLSAAAVTPIVAATALAVEPETGRVAVAGDDEVDLYSPGATLLRRVPDMFGVTHLAASGGDVFALLSASGEVARIDAATLQVTGRWVVTGVNDLHGLAFAAGHLWTTGHGLDELGVLASLDPTDGDVETLVTGARLHLAASPAAPDVLIGMFADADPVRFFRYQVTTGGVAVPRRSVVHDITSAEDLGITADGRRVRVLHGAIARIFTLDVETLAVEPTAPFVGPYPLAVEPSPTDPAVFLSATSDDLRDGDVDLFRDGTPRATVGWEASAGSHQVIPRGLAFAPDGTRAYGLRARSDPSLDAPAELLVLDPRGLTPVVAPQVVGRQGGGVLSVSGLEGPGAIVRIDGKGTTRTVGGDGRTASVFVPMLDPGLVDVSATGSSGSFRRAANQLRVAYLGPFRMGRTFIDQQIRDAAGRPATAAELQREEARMFAGDEPVEHIVRLARGTSFAGHRAPLVRLYRAVFLRPPDTAGVAYWLGELRRGRSLASVGQAFTASPEFRQRYGSLSNDAFVDQLYGNVFGRSPDAAGRRYWLDRLAAGTGRGEVVTLMSQSPEHVATTAGLVDVTLLHLLMLRRAATPDELDQNLRRPAAEVALDLLSSAEYARRFA